MSTWVWGGVYQQGMCLWLCRRRVNTFHIILSLYLLSTFLPPLSPSHTHTQTYTDTHTHTHTHRQTTLPADLLRFPVVVNEAPPNPRPPLPSPSLHSLCFIVTRDTGSADLLMSAITSFLIMPGTRLLFTSSNSSPALNRPVW